MKDFKEFEARLEKICSNGIRVGLSRLARLFALLGNPERRIPAVHVVGTNGKGSTAATLESILHTAGYKTALYTSPHLVSWGERVRIAGVSPGIEAFGRAMDAVERAIAGDETLAADPPTLFETMTAIAFVVIAEAAPDAAVIEAGMGGRWDATNTLGDVKCTVVAPIGLDHMAFLGDTVEKIAEEKFAVVRPRTAAVFAGDERLNERFRARCALMGAKATIMSEVSSIERIACGLRGTTFDLCVRDDAGGKEYLNLYTPLIGAHQARNASLAVLAARELAAVYPRIDDNAIRRGVERTEWRGRFEIRHGTPRLILDGAHNEHGVRALIDTINALRGELALRGIVYATMADKDISGTMQLIKSLGVPIYCTEVPELDRSMKAADLAAAAGGAGLEVAGAYPDPLDALKAAMERGDAICCGSLYLVGYVEERGEKIEEWRKTRAQ